MSKIDKTPNERPYALSHDRDRRRRGETVPPPIDEERDTDEITSPIDLLLNEDIQQDSDPVERLRRDSRDPYSLIYNLAEALTEEKKRERSSDKARADQLMQILDRAPNRAALELQDDVAQLKATEAKRAKGRRWLLGVTGTVLVAALGALLTGIGLMISKAEHEGENRAEMQRLKQDVQLLLTKGIP